MLGVDPGHEKLYFKVESIQLKRGTSHAFWFTEKKI